MGNFRHTAAWRKASRLAKRLSDGECGICNGGLGPLDFTIKDRKNPLMVEVDHIIAVDRGGALFDQENLHCAHQVCNRVKGVKSLEELSLQRAISLLSASFSEIKTTGIDWTEESDEDGTP